MKKEEIQKKIEETEAKMAEAGFWDKKAEAQKVIESHQDLKNQLDGVGKYDRGGAHLNIFAGAGGDDAEDFVGMLVEMYKKYIESKGWKLSLLDQSKNDLGGFRNVTFEIEGKNVYGNLKHESGVHRLVRQSPFNSKGQRHTSFAMVEFVPKFDNKIEIEIPEDELDIEFTKSSGPGGQNVNKRETAVRIVHKPTKLSAFISTERSQAQNREKALDIIQGKLYNRRKEEQRLEEAGMHVSKTTEAEWGSQIRSYVLHPYKLVKDHRTDLEVRDVDKVLGGDLDKFIEASKNNSL
jgi:peptide chain release factor 2